MSEEDQATLKELNDEIKALEKKIKDYKAKVPEDETTLDKHVNYLTSLNAQITNLLATKERLESKASAAIQQGK